PRACVRDEPDAGEDLVGLDHDLVGAVDALDPWRPVSEGPVDTLRPQIRRLEHVRVGRENHGRSHRLPSFPPRSSKIPPMSTSYWRDPIGHAAMIRVVQSKREGRGAVGYGTALRLCCRLGPSAPLRLRWPRHAPRQSNNAMHNALPPA